MTGTVQLSPVVAADNDLTRTVTVTINGTALPPIDATTSPAVFTCAPGDLITVTDIDTNSVGASPVSPVFSVTAPPLSVPVQPTVMGVTFA